MKKKNTQINIRIDYETKSKMKSRADEFDTSISALIRQSVLYGGYVKVDYSGFNDIIRQINAIGNNVNQIARGINVMNLDKEIDVQFKIDFLEQLKKLNDDIAFIQDQVIETIRLNKYLTFTNLDDFKGDDD